MPDKIYKCAPCKSTFNDSGNFYKHKKTQKHMMNEEKYIKKSNLAKKIYVKTKKKNDNDKEKELLHKMIEMKDAELRETKNELAERAKMLDKCVDVMKVQADTNKKSMSAFKHITRTYTKTPALEKLNDKEIAGMLPYKPSGKDKHKFEQLVIRSEIEKVLFEYVGGLIVDKYKPDDSGNQPIWISDISRFAFIVRQNIITKDKKCTQRWIKDREGLKITELIISPLLKRIAEIMIKYVDDLDDENNNEKSDNIKRADNVGKMEISNEVVTQIKLKQLHKKIVRYIAPYFNMNAFGVDFENSEFD